MESLIEATPLEQLWSCLGDAESKEKHTLLKFVLSRVNGDTKYSNDTDDVMGLATAPVSPGVQSHASTANDRLVDEIISDRNLPFFESNYHHYASLLLSNEAAALKEAFTAQTINLDIASILMVCNLHYIIIM